MGTPSVASMIADLEAQRLQLDAQRAKLDAAIAALKELASDAKGGVRAVSVKPPASRAPGSNSYRGMSIAAAAKEYLRSEGRPRSTREIAQALARGGLRHKSGNWTNTVRSSLARRVEKGDPQLVKGEVKGGVGTWRLVERKPSHKDNRASTLNGQDSMDRATDTDLLDSPAEVKASAESS